MRLLKILLILPIIGYGGVKGYIWYKTKNMADTAVAQMAPFAEVSYDSIYSSLSGAAGVEGLVIRPKMTSDEFRIQKLGFSAGSLLELFTLSKQFEQKKPPTHLGLEMEKVTLDLNSELISQLAQMQKQGSLQKKPTVIERMDAIACGNVEAFGIEQLTAMGYNQMVLDVAMDIGFQEELKRMNISMKFKDRELYGANFQASFRFDIAEIIAARGKYEPAIAALSLEYKDTGYYKLRNKYCAEQRGSSIEEYIDANIAGLSGGIGAKFPDDIVENYRQFMTKGGSFRVRLKPNEETKLSGLEFYRPNQVMDLLGVQIAINGVNLDRSKIDWGKVKKRSPVNISSTRKRKSKSSPKKVEKMATSPDVPAAKKPKFRTVRKSNLANHIGKRILVVTVAGKKRDGVLESVGKERIQIEVRLGMGEYSFPVKLKDIKQAQVYM